MLGADDDLIPLEKQRSKQAARRAGVQELDAAPAAILAGLSSIVPQQRRDRTSTVASSKPLPSRSGLVATDKAAEARPTRNAQHRV